MACSVRTPSQRAFRSAAAAPMVPCRSLVQCRSAAAAVPQATAVQAPPAVALQPAKVNQLDASQFESVASNTSKLLVVDVYTTWCGPCKMIAPELEVMAAELGEQVLMTKMDCTSNPENKKWAMAQGVKALPTFILFKDGKRVNDMTGAKSANLRKLIESHM